MVAERWRDQLQCFLWQVRQDIEASQVGARLHMPGVGIDRSLVQRRCGTEITESLGDLAGEITRIGIPRRNLHRVGELDTRLLEVAAGQILLSVRHMARTPGVDAATR
ncbi:MAG TPA: hypothetical protein VKB20_02390 [Steroidobacteraceae bacterium]|nr:hypothetical protein [Steroidobacteraceae bacterium]